MPKTNLPVQVKDAILSLTPKQEIAVLSYLDRGSPAFGNKTRAKKLAGYGEGTSGNSVFNAPEVQIALRELRSQQLELAGQVMSDIKALSPEAADELMAQLHVGREMEMLDPSVIFGKDFNEATSKVDGDRLRGISAYNATLAKVMKERRAAAETILAYAFGTPEQRVRVAHGETEDEVEAMLGKMSREDFDRLGRILFADAENGPDHEEIPVIEAEVLDED